jgi:hypothetical protein
MRVRLTRKKSALILLVVIVVVGLAWLGHSRPPGRILTLPSGKQIVVTGVGPVYFPSGETALVMACDTDISIDDSVALRKEADEIWGLFKKDVERAALTNGVIRMVHPEGSGLITHSKGYGFVFVKRADGLWHCPQDEKK